MRSGENSTRGFREKVKLLCWGLTCQPLWVILCPFPEKGRKEIGEIVAKNESEGQGRKRNRNECEETEEMETFPLYTYLLQG